MKMKPLKSFIAINFLYPIITIFLFTLCIIIYERGNLRDLEVVVGISIGLSIVLMLIIAWIITRLAYPIKYVFTSDKIIMYKKGKPYHIVRISDIVEVAIRKLPWWCGFWVPLTILLNAPEVLNVISFRYHSETPAPQRMYNYCVISTLTENEKAQGMVEMVDCFTLRQIRRICKHIDKFPKEIEDIEFIP